MIHRTLPTACLLACSLTALASATPIEIYTDAFQPTGIGADVWNVSSISSGSSYNAAATKGGETCLALDLIAHDASLTLYAGNGNWDHSIALGVNSPDGVLSAWVWVDDLTIGGDTNGLLRVDLYTFDGSTRTSSIVSNLNWTPTVAGQWQYFEADLSRWNNTGSSAYGLGRMILRNFHQDSGMVVYIRDLQVTPEPATMALLALGGLTLLKRRRTAH